MKQYVYECEIAGLLLQYRLAHSIQILESSAPFFREVTDESAGCPDLTVEWTPEEALPEIPEDTFRAGNSYFRPIPHNMEGYEVWHIPSPGRKPYAYMRWKDSAHVDARFDPARPELVSMSRQMLDLTGIETVLMLHGGFMLHASFIRYQGKAILFSAPSGTGKSTQANLWALHEGAEILNGDRTGLIVRGGRWYAYGLPYAGSSGIYRNECAPVAMTVMLSKASENRIEKLGSFRASMLLYPQLVMHRWDRALVTRGMELAEHFSGQIPIYQLDCLPDRGAVELVRQKFEEAYADE